MLTHLQGSDPAPDEFELQLAADLHGKQRAGSGAVWGLRRDVITPHMLIEAKTTKHPFYRLKAMDLFFLWQQAANLFRMPVYVVCLRKRDTIAIVPAGAVPALASDTTYNLTPRKSVGVRITPGLSAAINVAFVHMVTIPYRQLVEEVLPGVEDGSLSV